VNGAHCKASNVMTVTARQGFHVGRHTGAERFGQMLGRDAVDVDKVTRSNFEALGKRLFAVKPEQYAA
jgi:hypothetical protein